jgi:hypothetical protein
MAKHAIDIIHLLGNERVYLVYLPGIVNNVVYK